MSQNFDSQARAFSFLFCALVSLASLPLIGWHYWQTLHGFAVLALFGLLGVDLVLWFSSYWSTSASTASLKVAALAVKIALAGVMLLNAGAVLYIMRTDQQVATSTAQASASTVAEIAARAAAARELVATLGGRQAAREIARMPATVPPTPPSPSDSILPRWYLDFGVYTVPPIAALLGFCVLTICASIVRRAESQSEISDRVALPVQSSALAQVPQVPWIEPTDRPH
jgi:hypothetical protein